MKNHLAPYSKSKNAFTLIELLIVVGIMVVLAGLTVAGLGNANKQASKKATETFIAEIENALGKYEVEFGWFPVSPEAGVSSQDHGTRNSEGELGSAILYKELSGDFDEDGVLDDDTETYLEKLIDTKRSIEAPRGGGFWVLDPFNSPIRYLCEPRNEPNKETFNPTYDVWSIINTDPTEAGDDDVRKSYITNYGTR